MNDYFLNVLKFWEKETGIKAGVLIGVVQEALVSAAAKVVGPLRELRVVIDQKTGDVRVFARLFVVERVTSKHEQIAIVDARRTKSDALLYTCA